MNTAADSPTPRFRMVLAIILLSGLFARIPFLPIDFHDTSDLQAFRTWARTIESRGLTNAYDGTTINYPPLLLYWFGAAGRLAAGADDQWLTALVKLPAVLADVATAGLIALSLARSSPPLALVASAAYVFNPAVWFVSARWGQQDSTYTVFLAASVLALERRANVAAWALFALALLTKLQSLAVAPLLLVVTAVRHGARGLGRGVVAGLVVGVILTAPWLVTGNVFALVQSSFTFAGPARVDVSGYNLWYLLFGGQVHTLGALLRPANLPLTYQRMGFVAFGIFVLSIMFALRRPSHPSPAFAGATLTLGFFMLLTQIHERYMFPTLALLLLSLNSRARLGSGAAYVVLSVTFLFNLLTIVPIFGVNLVAAAPDSSFVILLKQLALAAAAINGMVLLWLIWVSFFF